LGAAAALLLAFASPGVTGSGGTSVVIPLTDSGWPQAPGLGEALSAPLALRGPARGPQLAETHASESKAAGEGPRFVLTAVAIEGVTAYRPDQLRPLYQDLLGREIALDAVFALAEAVTARYRNDGYTLSQAIVPPQTISAGKVRLTVVEGFIDKVLVEGETRGRAGLFRAWAEKIKASRPFQVAVLERYSLLANDLPGAQVRAVLRPSEETPGAADLVFEVKHQTFEAAANLDNRAPKTTGPLQGLVSVTGNSLLGLYDRTTLTYSQAKTRKRSQFAGIRHDQVLNSEGTGLSLSASYSRSEPGDVLKDLDLLSVSTALSAEVSHPVIRSRNANLNLSAGFTYREVKSDAVSARLFRDRLSVVSLGVSAVFTDPWNGRDAMELRVHKGLDAFNASVEGDRLLTRADGSGEFVKLTGSLSRTQHLGGGLSLYLAATGQLASRALLASEEFAFGGAGFGRAYDPSELTGDRGGAVVAEIRVTGQPDIPILNFYQLYGFYDLGATYDIGVGGSEAKRSGASAGLGLRFGLTDYVSGQLELAKPMTRPVSLEDNGKAARIFFRLSARF
jgi:hemolysin activation/secretion protein